MEAIINFIKDALEVKTLSASWIVTLTVALTSIGVIGYASWQEYKSMQVDIETLKAQAQEAIEAYDDGPVVIRVNRLEEKVDNISKSLDRTQDKFDNRNINPLSL